MDSFPKGSWWKDGLYNLDIVRVAVRAWTHSFDLLSNAYNLFGLQINFEIRKKNYFIEGETRLLYP